jgi:hypothetical protein
VTTEVRFGLGRWGGLCSSTWKVWPGSDGSVYIADREIGAAIKVSLHPRRPAYPEGEWRVAFNSDEIAKSAAPDATLSGRVIDAWDSEINRLPSAPLRQAFAVILGRPSLGYMPFPPDVTEFQRLRRHRTRGVDWSALIPDLDHLWQFTVLIGDPKVNVSAPGTRALGAVPVGHFVLPSSEQVWVMRHLIPFTEAMKAKLTERMQALVNAGQRPQAPLVRRGHFFGKEPDGLRWIFAVAATFGPIPSEFENF